MSCKRAKPLILEQIPSFLDVDQCRTYFCSKGLIQKALWYMIIWKELCKTYASSKIFPLISISIQANKSCMIIFWCKGKEKKILESIFFPVIMLTFSVFQWKLHIHWNSICVLRRKCPKLKEPFAVAETVQYYSKNALKQFEYLLCGFRVKKRNTFIYFNEIWKKKHVLAFLLECKKNSKKLFFQKKQHSFTLLDEMKRRGNIAEENFWTVLGLRGLQQIW